MERRVVGLVARVLGGEELATPGWLQRPDAQDCGRRWPLIQRIYHSLTGLKLPEVMPSRERRTVDLVIQCDGELPRIVEFDETQHFNAYRALTIRAYPRSARVCFDRRLATRVRRQTPTRGWGVRQAEAAFVPRRGRPTSAARLPRCPLRPASPDPRMVANSAYRGLRGRSLAQRV